VAVNPIAQGAQIAVTDVQPASGNLGMDFLLKPGQRAITIALDPISSVAGFVKPGNHVDILCTFQGKPGRTLTRTVLQNVYLLATGSQVLPSSAPPQQSNTTIGGGNNNNTNAANPDGDAQAGSKPIDVPNATVLVTPTDAEKLILAVQKGKLQLALRSATDQTMDEIPAVHESVVTTQPPDVQGGGGGGVRTVVKYIKVPAPLPPSGGLPPVTGISPLGVPTQNSIMVVRGASSSAVSVSP
jgi:pilus assembly protein CpaB